MTGTLSDGGAWSTTVTVSDSTYSANTTVAWAVSSPVVIQDPSDQANAVGDTVSLIVHTTDNASGTLSYSGSGLPSGLSIDSSSGAITGTISSGADTSSPYTTVIAVTDGTRTAVDSFTWDVSAAGPVILAKPDDQTNAVGDMLAVQLQGEDTNHAALYFAESGLPDGLYINPQTGLIFGTLASDAATSTVTVSASDGSNSASQSFTWTVNAAATVLMTNPGDQTNSEGDSVSLSISTSGSSSLSFAALGLPSGLKINTSTGVISGTVALGDSAGGPYTVTVLANDGTYSAAQTFQWTINDPIVITAPADQTNTEADTVSLSITATDSSSGTLSYAALGLPAGLKINPSTGAITGTIAAGATSGTVTLIAGDGTYGAEQSFDWTINSAITITAPDTQTNVDGDTPSLTVSATDSTSGTLSYSALGLPPGLSINATTGAITGTVAVGDSGIGVFEPTIIASDGTYSASTDFEWDVNAPVTITDPGAQANTVGDVVTLPIQASGSGTLTYAAAGLPIGLSIDTATGVISGTIGSSAASIGTFSTTVTVNDGSNTATDTFSWQVRSAWWRSTATIRRRHRGSSTSPSMARRRERATASSRLPARPRWMAGLASTACRATRRPPIAATA
jgi:hypothetical protein